MRRARAWGSMALALALLGGLAACSDDGGDDGSEGPTTTEATTSTGPAVVDPCPLVTTEAVAEAFGLVVELVDGGEDACDFTLGDTASLIVTTGQPPATSQEDCDPDSVVEVDVEASDGVAWSCLVAGVPTAVVLEGEAAVALRVTGEVAAEASRDALVRLLPQVTPDA